MVYFFKGRILVVNKIFNICNFCECGLILIFKSYIFYKTSLKRSGYILVMIKRKRGV